MKSTCLLLALLAGLLSTARDARAQQLLVNGQSTAEVGLGDPLTLDFFGPPGMPHFWSFDTDPGPTPFGPISLPIGFGPDWIELGFGTPLPPGGQRTVSLTPTLPGLTRPEWIGVGALLDPSVPGGVSLSPTISFAILAPGIDAGADVLTPVGEPVLLDGSAHAGAFGGPAPGFSLQWVLLEAPVSSTATLEAENDPFCVLTPDVPGLYRLELQATGPSGFGRDRVEVLALAPSLSSPGVGAIGSGPIPVSGVISGPGPYTVAVDGVPATQFFGAFAAPAITPTDVVESIPVRIELADGRFLGFNGERTQGIAVPRATPCPSCLAIRFRQGALDALEAEALPVIEGLDLNAAIQAIPTTSVISNAPLLSAALNPTSGSFNAGATTLHLVPTPSGIAVTLTLSNVVVNATVSGQVVFVNYSENATITASTATLTGLVTLGSNPQGQLDVSLSNVQAQLGGFNFSVSGVLNTIAQIGLIQDALRAEVEGAIEDQAPQVEAALQPLLADLVLAVDLTGSGIPLALDLPIDSVGYDAQGFTVRNLLLAQATSLDPAAPPLNAFRGGSSLPPSPGSFTPSGQSYDLATLLSEDLLNAILTELVRAGTLDLSLTGTLGSGATALPLVAQSFALLLPQTGFEQLPPATPIRLRARFEHAPVVTFAPQTAQGTARLHFGGLRLDALAELPGRTPAAVLALELAGGIDVDLAIDAAGQELLFAPVPGTLALETTVRRPWPGNDPTFLLSGLGQVVELLLPGLLDALDGLPVPGTPIGQPLLREVGASATAPTWLLGWFDL